jgi:GGDEF domain-containing protein
MVEAFDSSVDPLADAPLSAEQRRIWDQMRARNGELEQRLLQYERDESQSLLHNRNDFTREVARMLAFDERYGGTSSILYLDLEGADLDSGAAVQEISTVLAHGVRSSDIIGRLAPKEFGILLMRCDSASAWRKGETLSAKLEQALAQLKLNIKVSYGAYTFRDNEDLAVGLKEAAQSLTRKG